jgi:molybdenum cofactor cytidylyltransferase
VSVAAIILAAGESRRLGRPKQLLDFGGGTLLRRAVMAAVGAGCEPVLVVLGADAEVISPTLSGTVARVLLNADWAKGMSSSIRLAIETLSSDPEIAAALMMVCDQPLVDAAAIGSLIERHRESADLIVAAEYVSHGETVRGVPAIFPRRFFAALTDLHGAAGARSVISRNAEFVSALQMPGAAFDIDSGTDILNMQRLAYG